MTAEKIILGIDPGTTVMGFGIISTKGSKMELVSIHELVLKKYPNHETKLKYIFEKTLALIDEYHPDEVALEAPFYGKNVQSMLKLAQESKNGDNRKRKRQQGAGSRYAEKPARSQRISDQIFRCIRRARGGGLSLF